MSEEASRGGLQVQGQRETINLFRKMMDGHIHHWLSFFVPPSCRTSLSFKSIDVKGCLTVGLSKAPTDPRHASVCPDTQDYCDSIGTACPPVDTYEKHCFPLRKLSFLLLRPETSPASSEFICAGKRWSMCTCWYLHPSAILEIKPVIPFLLAIVRNGYWRFKNADEEIELVTHPCAQTLRRQTSVVYLTFVDKGTAT